MIIKNDSDQLQGVQSCYSFLKLDSNGLSGIVKYKWCYTESLTNAIVLKRVKSD